MSELQTFGSAIPLAQAPAPRNLGSTFQDAAAAVTGLLGTGTQVAKNDMARKEREQELRVEAEGGRLAVHNEIIKRRESISEAVESGYMTQEQATSFGKDELASLDALNQAQSIGMSASVKNALERSVVYQHAVMRNPGAAKTLAERAGVGDTTLGADTLVSLEKLEREILHSDANVVRQLAQEAGYVDFLGRSDEEALLMWVGSPEQMRNTEMKQLDIRIKSQELSLKERSFSAQRRASLQLSTIGRDMSFLERDYRESRGDGRQGATENKMSLPQVLNLWADEQIGLFTRENAEFPILIENFTKTVRSAVNARISTRAAGLSATEQERRNEVLFPIEVANRQAQLEGTIYRNSQNEVTAMTNVVKLQENITSYLTRIAKMKDEVANAPSSKHVESLSKVIKDPSVAHHVALIAAAGIQTGSILQNLTDPASGKFREEAEMSVAAISLWARDGQVNEEQFSNILRSIVLAHEANVDLAPHNAKILQESLLSLSSDPVLMKMAKESPAVRTLLRPYTAGIKTQMSNSMRSLLDEVARDTVSLMLDEPVPSRLNNMQFAKKLGDIVVLDTAATDKAGVPQYKLRDNAISTMLPEQAVLLKEALVPYNKGVILQSDPRDYTMFRNLSGASSVSSAVLSIINDDIDLSSLNPEVSAVDEREQSATSIFQESSRTGEGTLQTSPRFQGEPE